jgi:hypothetical protein
MFPHILRHMQARHKVSVKGTMHHNCTNPGLLVQCFLVLVEEVEDEDDYTPEGMGEPERGVPRPPLKKSDHFPKDLPDLMDIHHDDNIEIEEGNHIFVATIHPEDTHHFMHVSNTVSQRLAKAFTRNSGQTSFQNSMPESLHNFEDIFNKKSFDSLPNQHKWDHTIELE